MFTSGTAVVVGPVESFHYKNNEYQLPLDPAINSGRLAKELSDKIQAIMVIFFNPIGRLYIINF